MSENHVVMDPVEFLSEAVSALLAVHVRGRPVGPPVVDELLTVLAVVAACILCGVPDGPDREKAHVFFLETLDEAMEEDA